MVRAPSVPPAGKPVPWGRAAMSLVATAQGTTSAPGSSPPTDALGKSRLLDDIAAYATHWRQPRSIWAVDETLSNFEAHFKSFSRPEQERIYQVAYEIACDFCENDLDRRDSLIKDEEDLFAFPYAKVALSDFDQINALWAIMDRELGRAEGPRFVIDVPKNLFVFGMAQSHSFKSVPVTQFTNVIASRAHGSSEHSRLNAFILNGKDHIFIVRDPRESKWQKMRGDRLAETLWQYAVNGSPEAASSKSTFEEAAKDFGYQQTLLHEYGHLLSFKDARVKNDVLEPFIMWEGRKYLHPSFEEFHALGEVYPDLHGIMDFLVESRNDAAMALAFAYYKRTLTSSRANARNRAVVLIPIFLRNVHLDHEHQWLKIDYDGFRSDLEAQKDHLYRLFEQYRNVSSDVLAQWVADFEGFWIRRNLERTLDSEEKRHASVESDLRITTLESLGVTAGIPKGSALRMLQNFRKDYDDWPEEALAKQRLPDLVEELRWPYEIEALNKHVQRSIRMTDDGRPRKAYETSTHFSPFEIPTHFVPAYVGEMNELLGIERRVHDAEFARNFINKAMKSDAVGNFVTSQGRITGNQIWVMLRDAGYLNDAGVVQAKFTGKREDFSLPTLDEIMVDIIFQKLSDHVEQRRQSENQLLSLEDLDRLAARVTHLSAKYPEDESVAELIAEIEATIDKVRALTQTASSPPDAQQGRQGPSPRRHRRRFKF